MECQEFFEQNAQNRAKCKELQKFPVETQIEWESQRASSASPGPVNDAEVLVRQIMSPLHFDEEAREFKAAAFSDVKDKGCSVNRLAHTTEEALKAVLAQRVERTNANPDRAEDRYPWGLLHLSCAALRSITTAGPDGIQKRGLVVYDTALPEDRSHADVCQTMSEGGQARSIRKSLLDLANAWLRNQVVA
jgi:hypothetical protein